MDKAGFILLALAALVMISALTGCATGSRQPVDAATKQNRAMLDTLPKVPVTLTLTWGNAPEPMGTITGIITSTNWVDWFEVTNMYAGSPVSNTYIATVPVIASPQFWRAFNE